MTLTLLQQFLTLDTSEDKWRNKINAQINIQSPIRPCMK